MRRLISSFLVFACGVVAAAVLVTTAERARSARVLQARQAVWDAEKAELEDAFEAARAQQSKFLAAPVRQIQPPSTVMPDARALLKELAASGSATPSQPRALRAVLVKLQQLTDLGPPALPAIREFLAGGQDTAFATAGGKPPRDIKAITEALVPATLRFGLFDVVRQIRGPDAEGILAEALGRSVRGLEIAYLAELLEELSPGKYRDLALTTARGLLAGNGTEREQLFGVLTRFGDSSYVSLAQAGLIQADGKVDKSAVRYLQQTLGQQSVAVAAQYYQDPRLTEPGSKEPLARLALAYVGTNPQALELFHAAVVDPALLPDQRRELVEDLNQDGLSNTKMPTPQDLQVINQRYALTQAYLQQDFVLADQVLSKAFREADKDLRKMLERAAAAANPPAGK